MFWEGALPANHPCHTAARLPVGIRTLVVTLATSSTIVGSLNDAPHAAWALGLAIAVVPVALAAMVFFTGDAAAAEPNLACTPASLAAALSYILGLGMEGVGPAAPVAVPAHPVVEALVRTCPVLSRILNPLAHPRNSRTTHR